ncbi:ubiquitin C-terminal hydrolase family protein [Colletotrichum tofieldiae]|uniref:ubiquitinyl hydrolase 1 n=1 Tax=Colletotrichum tofieldiae TaxID=708197 RepID=A0A161YFG8_9PEZI|nr:ubiquitin C-terminal hydrolase family protein [Colletotrichum tofieldiae]GKT84855.1 ubiquitin C-terminal hydrolase family protein [Colletotrichum tofieldiae]
MKGKKFLSLRDRNGNHRRSKSSEPGHKSRPLSAEAFRALFKSDRPPSDDEVREKETAKVHEGLTQQNHTSLTATQVEDITRLLAESNITDVSPEHIRDSLNSKFAEGDVDKTVEFIQLQCKAMAGKITHYNPQIEMVGAENRGNVTCYLDSLLFAMFAKLDAFECMLKNEFTDEPRRRLVTLLRLWVNMLRSGKMIHTDMTKLIQDALADCGWSDAKLLEQQDTSEAFAFVTETLQLPLLQLQVDLFHQGKNDKDDHKLVYERLLNLAVPPDPEGKGIRLEDCLEEYFNTQVDVLRDSHEEKKELERSASSKNTIRLVTREDGQESEAADTLSASPLPLSPVLERRWTASQPPNGAPESPSSSSRPTPRHRSTSVIQRVVLEEKEQAKESETPSMLEKARRTSSTVVKAVTIPAWQFFRLIPWHAAGNKEPKNDMEVAMNFNQRPVVGICLKRYMMTNSGIPQRQNTFIDIPDSLRLPHFMLGDETKLEEDPNGFSMEYKLVLQSVVCHRGDSLYSGHYISFARVAPKLLTDNRRHELDPPPDYEEAQWVKFDDLDIDSRVTYVDDIKQALKDEMPYLLFYQIVPMVEVASTEETETEPPSYNESKVSVNLPTTPNPVNGNGNHSGMSSSKSDYFENTSISPPKAPSIRFSSELERPSRISFGDDEPYLGFKDSRRGSVNFTDSTHGTPSITPDAVSPAVTPGEETTAQRLSRAAALFTGKNKSRPTSQAGEGRISLTMSRIGGLMRPSKEPLRDSSSNASNNALVASASAPVPDSVTEEEFVENAEADQTPVADPERKDSKDLKERRSSEHHHKHVHKRGKSKNRSAEKKKNKGGEEPERECVVM